MKRNIIALIAVSSLAAFIPATASACDGSGGSGNGAEWHHRHHGGENKGPNAGAGQGLNKGVNLSLNQGEQTHNGWHGKNWGGNRDKQNHPNG